MIFLGDISCPHTLDPKIDFLPESFSSQFAVANLEGAIARYAVAEDAISKTVIFNGENVVKFLKSLNVRVVALSNNHITDLPGEIQNTLLMLDEAGIAYCGAGLTLEEASRPAVIEHDGKTYVFLSFGWSTVSCKYVKDGSFGVNPLTLKNVIDCTQKARIEYPNSQIIIMPHWDYELEKYPMPMHRQLAKIAIDNGADGIFGSHSHCVQGIEYHNSAPIVYSLGNWWFPHGIFWDGRCSFPSYSIDQIAVEWSNNAILCHWYRYDVDSNELKYINSEFDIDSQKLKRLSQFTECTDEEYVAWFKKNRVKNKGLPIYSNYNDIVRNNIKDLWVFCRQIFINILLVIGLKRSRKEG